MCEVIFRAVKEYHFVKVRIGKIAQKRIEKLTAEGKCLACERKLIAGERVSCGDCMTCYNGAIYAIGQGKVTRNELIREGKMLEPKPRGRKPANKFTAELAKR